MTRKIKQRKKLVIEKTVSDQASFEQGRWWSFHKVIWNFR